MVVKNQIIAGEFSVKIGHRQIPPDNLAECGLRDIRILAGIEVGLQGWPDAVPEAAG